MSKNINKAASVDVMLLLEGTFPYVSGGVSSWVNQMIRAFPELQFGIVFIGSRRQDYDKMAYPLPDNVAHFEAHYLYDFPPAPMVQRMSGDAEVFERTRVLHDMLREPGKEAQAGHMLQELMPALRQGGALSEDAFLYSEQSWNMITEQYRRFCTDPSFTDYFWTIRTMHKPLWLLMKIADGLIPAKVYHSVSTGYAGFLGALLRHRNHRPLLVSEHGIYTKERKIDLFQSQWIRDNRNIFERDVSNIGYFRELWVRFFETLGRVCYEAADEITALYEGSRSRQLLDGAPAQRTNIIPNGINLPRLAALRQARDPQVPPVLCLIGRVVPIKDIKTFIRAMLTVVQANPDAEGWIVGPEDEDPDYALECRNLAESLGLRDKVKFMGFQKIDTLLPKVGVLVLSSISEALPLVILEGFAAGVPCVATDVGACSELIFGVQEDDTALGRAGEIVRIADPSGLAHAALGLLQNPERWHAAQAAGIARVERYYTQEQMVERYRVLYSSLLEMPDDLSGKPPSAPRARCPVHTGAH